MYTLDQPGKVILGLTALDLLLFWIAFFWPDLPLVSIVDYSLYFGLLIYLAYDASSLDINRLRLAKLPLTAIERTSVAGWVGAALVAWLPAFVLYGLKRHFLLEACEKSQSSGFFRSNQEKKAYYESLQGKALEEWKARRSEEFQLLGFLLALLFVQQICMAMRLVQTISGYLSVLPALR